MPRTDNGERIAEIYQRFTASLTNDSQEEINELICQSAGARTDEEKTKTLSFHQEIRSKGYRNASLEWIDGEDGRFLRVGIAIYSDASQTEFWEDEVPDEDKLAERNLVKDSDGDVDYDDMISSCEHCGCRYCVDKMVQVEDNDDVMYCYECANDCLHRCEHCDRWFESSEEFEEVYRDYDDYIGYWCPTCQRENGAEWSDEDERMYLNTGGRMQKFLHKNGILAMGTPDCPDCRDSEGGWCQRHLKEKIKEMEEEATNLWVYDTERRNYHESGHQRFKSLKYRMEKEHPYLYYGIEWEVLWDAHKGSYEKVVKEFIEATDGMFVAEYDRSVDDRGMQLGHYIGAEFISRPTSYKRWVDPKTIERLKKGAEVLKKYGAMNPQDTGCGLHVHMSKTFFEKNTTKKVKDIKSDMDWFFQFFQPEIEKISRREYTQYCASKAFRMKNAVTDFRNNNAMFGVKGKFQMEKGLLTVSQGSGITHHDCVIETPRTIEARTFRSTIDVKDILATIEFCRGLAHAARNRTGLTGKTFGDIMFTKDSPYLLSYVEHIKLDTSRKLQNKLEVKI